MISDFLKIPFILIVNLNEKLRGRPKKCAHTHTHNVHTFFSSQHYILIVLNDDCHKGENSVILSPTPNGFRLMECNKKNHQNSVFHFISFFCIQSSASNRKKYIRLFYPDVIIHKTINIWESYGDGMVKGEVKK